MSKRIIYIHQTFRTPQQGGIMRSYYLAKGLVDKGFDIEMVTSHKENQYKYEEIDGIKVHYLPVSYDNKQGYFRRIISFFRFYKKALALIRSLPKADLCYAMSTPLTVGMLALRLKKEIGLPYYFEVGDLWPDAPIQMGVIKDKFTKKRLKKIEHNIYASAEKIIALSTDIKKEIEEISGRTDVGVLTNIADIDYYIPTHKSEKLLLKYKLGKSFVITYAGAIGRANHLEFLLRFAEKAQPYDYKFLVLGDGSELKRLKRLARRMKLENLQFLGYMNKEGVKEVYNVTDAVYISFLDKPVLHTGCPNKYFDALAGGKLPIVNFGGWVKEEIEKEDCGLAYDPHSPEEGVFALEKIARTGMQYKHRNNARRLAVDKYAKDKLVDALEAYLISLG